MVYQRLERKRILLHLLFWLCTLMGLIILYGFKLPSYPMSIRNNTLYLPLHIIYFYTVAYILIPKYLLTGKYIQLILYILLLAFVITVLTRLLDIYWIDPYIDNYQKMHGEFGTWWKTQGTPWQQLINSIAFTNALRGANMVVWIAVTIKLFKMWYDKRKAALSAELSFLKAQVHPHFLFNTLNNLYALTLKQSAKAPQVVMGLSEILRYMLYECDKNTIPLKKEIEILESYIALEQIRYEDRLDLNFNIQGVVQNQQIAPLLMITFLENAFKHGTSEQVGEVWIKIDCIIKDQQLKFTVANSKANSEVAKKPSGKLGLNNLKKRLEILYPDAHVLVTDEDENMYLASLELQLDKLIKL